MSGLGSLYLLSSEIQTLSKHYKQTLEGLQKLYQKTPEPVVFFLGGSLPLPAQIHIRQLTLFAMVCRLPENILHRLAKYILTSLPDSTKSWFLQIKKLCFTYNLPHPLLLLADPPTKASFSHRVRLNVLDFWQTKLRQETAELPSLRFFKPQFMSLSQPHPLWTTCGSNRYEINKACCQAKYLSGRFRSEKLLSHFGHGNLPFCQLHPEGEKVVGDLAHHLVHCSALADRRECLFDYWNSISSSSSVCNQILKCVQTSANEDDFLQFILDCSSVPTVIAAAQEHGADIYKILFKACRTYCYSLYRARLKLLSQWS